MSRTPRKRQRLGAAGLSTIKSQLTERDLAIVRTIQACRLATTRHIERLHFSQITSLYTRSRICRRVLQRLSDDEVLRRRARRIGGMRAGSASYVYALGPAGARLTTGKRTHHYTTEPSDYFLKHTLALTELYVQLHEHAAWGSFQLLEIQTEPPCWRTFTSLEAGTQVLKPDMYVRMSRNDEEFSYFIEMDRGTTYATSLLRKIRAYEQYYLTGKEQETHAVFPQVVWMVPDGKRKKLLTEFMEAANKRVPGMMAAQLFGSIQSFS
jgi:hypothetical protein